MGREIRRVPPGWQHPKRERFNYRLGRMEEEFQPLRDRDVQSAFTDWMAEYQAWLAGGHDEAIAKYPGSYPKEEPYRSFCEYSGGPPDPDFYRPNWPAESATWFAVYETVSEGTPVTPPFATKEELIDYLVANGDFWDQKRRREGYTTIECGPWGREAARRFVENERAPSLIVAAAPERGVQLREPRDG